MKRNAFIVLLASCLLSIRGLRIGIWQRFVPAQHPPSLIDATIDSLGAGLDAKLFTSVDLVKTYIARITEVNDLFNAINEINPDALEIAANLDSERAAGIKRGPLHGIPILLKDNIATRDSMNNTAGSYALLKAQVPEDSTVAKRLRAAGAILLGKANLSEWANWRSLNTSNGWSAVGGQSYGPYYPNEDPLGSSSGSAIASALGLALGTLGTETDGSITLPASFNNIVGIKPTVGLTSRYLVVPISEHQDTVGPMTRNVKDAAYILQAIAGPDPKDNYTLAIPNQNIPDYVAACKTSALKGMRLGIPRNVMAMHTDAASGPQKQAFEQALLILREAGAIIVDDTNFKAAEEFRKSDLWKKILGADFAVNLHGYLKLLTVNPNNINSLADLQEFTHSFPVEEYSQRDTGRFEEALQNWNNTTPSFWSAYQRNLYFGQEGGLLGAISLHNLDAVILPANYASSWAAMVGAPIVTVPLGSYPADMPIEKDSWGLVETAPNIPFGLSFIGATFTESKLIGMGYAFQQRTMVRKTILPYVSPSSELPSFANYR